MFGNTVGLDEVQVGLLPEEKVAAVATLLQRHGQVAMGGAGTDVALETADVALMADDLDKLPFAVGLSRASRRIIRQNLWISLSVIALLIPATFFGLADIGPAVIIHEGSTLIVVFNALRLLNYREAGVTS